MTLISPHKYLKYVHTAFPDQFRSRKAVLEAAAKLVAGTIVDSERFVKKNGIDGPFAIEISNGKETWHIPFSIAKGKFKYELTLEEEGIAEEWLK